MERLLNPRQSSFITENLEFKKGQITLFCLPASSKTNYIRRCKEFSEHVCDWTGMDNSFSHVKYFSDGTAKSQGGGVPPKIHLDEEYFKGRYVLMFDDVITVGHSMMVYRQKLKRIGAIVLACIALGYTTHTPPEDYCYEDEYEDGYESNSWI